MNLLLRATHPDHATDGLAPDGMALPFEMLDFGQHINEPGSMTFRVRHRVSDWFDDWATGNPARTLVDMAVYDVDVSTTAAIWCGYVTSRNAIKSGDFSIAGNAIDYCARVRQCLTAATTTRTGQLYQTAALAINGASHFDLIPMASGGLVYYPSPATYTNAWYPLSGTYKTLDAYLAGGCDAADTTIISIHAYDRGIPPSGICKIDGGDYFSYDGWDLNDVGISSAYVWKNCVREIFGSTALATATINTEVFHMRPKRIHPDTTVVVRGNAGGTGWEDIDPGNYDIDVEGGCIRFKVDPLTTAMTPALSALPTAIEGYWKVYDETAAATYILGGNDTYGIIELLLKTTKAHGGPELTNADYSITMDRIPVTRVYLDSPMLLGDALESLLTDPGGELIRSMPSAAGVGGVAVPTQLIGTWWNYGGTAPGDYTVKQLPLTTASTRITQCKSITEYANNTEVYNAICVYYQSIYGSSDAPTALIAYLTGSYEVLGPGGVIYKSCPYVRGAVPTPRFAPPINLGTCSPGAALSIARGKLVQSLHMARSRDYVLRHSGMTIPVLGNNYLMPDGYEGTCTGWRVSAQAGTYTITMTVVDMTEEYS